MTTKFDIIIIGGGAAGLAAAYTATARKKHVLILDMGDRPARKVMASGGGRCNFTNMDVGAHRYFGENPDFVRGALSRVTPGDVIEWATSHGIQPIEKAPGQYFSDSGAGDIVSALLSDANDAAIKTNTTVRDVEFTNGAFTVITDNDKYSAQSVIIATGGTSFGTLGVSDFGMKIAKKFGHKIIPPRPGLCAVATNAFTSDLSGISLPVQITVGKHVINDSMLFTHFGIGGPATYRATVRNLDDIHINLLPNDDVVTWLKKSKKTNGRKTLNGILGEKLPARVAKFIARDDTRNIADIRDCEIETIAARITDIVIPKSDIKLHNLASAEVIRGGVDTREISSKTMESKLQPGLFFVGEVIDIAGDLGGFNLHWAWASGRTAGNNA